MEGFVGKMGEENVRGCISKHMMCIELDRGFGVREESIRLSNLSLSCEVYLRKLVRCPSLFPSNETQRCFGFFFLPPRTVALLLPP